MANGQNDEGFVPPPVLPQGPPGSGSALGDFSAGLTKIGTNLLASGASQYFDSPAIGQAISDLSDLTTGMMQQRFWQAEFENFQQSYGVQYQAAAMKTLEDYNTLDDSFGNDFSPETLQKRNQALRDLMQNVQTLDLQFMQNAAKFGHNPLIGNTANALMQHRAQWMKNILGGFGEVTANAQEQAKLAAAQFAVSPEMQDLKKQDIKAGIEQKRASAAASRAAATQKDKTFQFPPKNVPVSQLPNYLTSTNEGRKVLEPYVAQAEADLTKRLLARNPDLQFKPDELRLEIDKQRPTINKNAAFVALQDTLPPDAFAELVSTNPRLRDSLLSEAPATDSPSIAQKLSPSEVRRLVRDPNEGLGNSIVMKAAENIARRQNITSYTQLKKIIKEKIDITVNGMVGDFSGSDAVKENLSTEMEKFFENNWHRNEFLNEVLEGNPRKAKESEVSGFVGVDARELRRRTTKSRKNR